MAISSLILKEVRKISTYRRAGATCRIYFNISNFPLIWLHNDDNTDDNNDDSSNTCPCYNAPQLVESTSTMPPTTCQNQQQVSNTDRSHLNDGDLIPQSTDCDTNQQRENSSLNYIVKRRILPPHQL